MRTRQFILNICGQYPRSYLRWRLDQANNQAAVPRLSAKVLAAAIKTFAVNFFREFRQNSGNVVCAAAMFGISRSNQVQFFRSWYFYDTRWSISILSWDFGRVFTENKINPYLAAFDWSSTFCNYYLKKSENVDVPAPWYSAALNSPT